MEQNSFDPNFHPPMFTGVPNYNFPPPPIPPMNWASPAPNCGPFFHPSFHREPSFIPCFPPPPPPPPQKSEEIEDRDRMWIAKLSDRCRIPAQLKPKSNSSIKISTFKEKLKKCETKIKELESLSNCLAVLKKTLDANKWTERCNEIERKKVELSSLLEEIDDKMIKQVEMLVGKRLKKRQREKSKRAERRQRSIEAKVEIEHKHRQIDLWLEKMKDEVERTKREEQVKYEADLVLSEVTQKKSEAKRTIALLNTLSKLRNARVTSLRSRGETVSESEIDTFSQVTDKLKKYWVDQVRGYNLEEQGLRVMLNDAEVERCDVQLSIKKDISKQWTRAFFSTKTQRTTKYEPSNLEELIHVRFEWDKFVCSDDMVMGSNIPVGWVVPSEPSSEEWAKLLHR